MLRDVEMRDGSAGSCGKSKEIVEAQRTYYMEGKTRALSARIDALNRLEQSILTVSRSFTRHYDPILENQEQNPICVKWG